MEKRTPYQIELFKFIEENNLVTRVIWEGIKDDVFNEYATSHIHVLASLSEGCPTCILEAMSLGLPSIGFDDCPGTNELIKHNANGLLAKSDDRVAGLEVSLRRLMDSPSLCEYLGKQALLDSVNFDPQHTYNNWEQLFYDAATYKTNPDRLFQEQYSIDPEKAMHAKRMIKKLMQNYKVITNVK
ncbi:UDP-D-galactose:(glucosyl)lipopolysaccharide-1%2 C6-D-galactosyltransferase [Candidatus Venteria ishoeyi]|uniref:UDP-D-galactose:(Glucosyl)lipopolysaccharide-1%2 C6-D-galactosyltransferase n=1 Tax=Candidatus Venteria ishoeyi TaxID=1899563 RepID=A0A1H6FDW9_9GAMM|nr:UDP-D-galactose:(glucosyl)lipopolysaccharide-1%2 C6-D-galactosyltransferase [Candidatus Venteria ishoeyi]